MEAPFDLTASIDGELSNQPCNLEVRAKRTQTDLLSYIREREIKADKHVRKRLIILGGEGSGN